MNEERARARIEAAVQQVVASGAETGVQVMVIKNGRAIADAVAGTADPATGAAVSADTLLFGFRNPFSGQLEGFDIDMVRRVAQEIFGDPNRIEYRALTYAQRIPALEDGSVDIVADVMTINCTR